MDPSQPPVEVVPEDRMGLAASPRRPRWTRHLRNPKVHVTSLIALAVVLVLVIAFPRPNFRLTDTRIQTSACVPPATSQTVLAAFRVNNSGSGGGIVIVELLSDGSQVSFGEYDVPARSAVAESLTATIGDCLTHTFSLDWCYPGTTRGGSMSPHC